MGRRRRPIPFNERQSRSLVLWYLTGNVRSAAVRPGVDVPADLHNSRLYFVCDERPGDRALADVLPRALAGGVDVFQLRMKSASDDAVLAAAGDRRAASAVRQACRSSSMDRPDLAFRNTPAPMASTWARTT